MSYGTHLALATLRRHPKLIGRVVLVSAEGLDQTAKSPAAGDRYFERVQQSVNADEAARDLYPDIAGMIRRVLERVASKPVAVQVETSTGVAEIVLGAFELQRLAADRIADPSGTAGVLRGFALAESGDYSWFGRRAQRVTGEPIHLRPMLLAMDVASGASLPRRELIAREAETALLGDALGWPLLHLGSVLADLDLGEEFRRPFRATQQALFVSGLLDGRTYPGEHRRIAAQFAKSVHVLVENGGHNTALDSSAVRAMILAFFRGESLTDTTVSIDPPRWVEEDVGVTSSQ